MKRIRLGTAILYSRKKVKLSQISLDTYVTTDNLLQDKAGVTTATNLPPKGNSFPRYDASDILISNIRPYLKKIWFSNRSGSCSSDVLVLSPNKGFNSKFVYYSIFRDEFFEHVMKGTKGTKMPRGDKDQILEFQIPDFPRATQDKIAILLSTIDSKIALNNSINDNLAQIAKTLYDYWFVQFDFPNADGKPYKSSGGEMVYNEVLKREIPKGWEVKSLFDTCDVQYGFPFSTSHFNEEQIGRPVIRIRDILENSISTYSAQDNIDEKYRLLEGDLLIGMDGNFHLNIWSKKDCYLNQRVVRIRKKKDILSNYIAFYQIEPFIKLRERSVSRTTVGHLSDKDLKSIKMFMPPESLRKRTNNIFDDLLLKTVSNKKQNQELASLRDFLLPMLMNGQVKVE